MRLPAALLLALLGAGCVSDPGREPVPGRVSRIYLLPGAPPAQAFWPDSYRRAARFVIENRTGSEISTLIADLSRNRMPPRELLEVVVEEPAGRAASILPSPHGTWPLRALLGTPGGVLLAPGEGLTLLVRVAGEPGRCRLVVTVPGVTEE